MIVLVILCILTASVLIILGAVKNKINYLLAGDLTLLFAMIINMARSYNFSQKAFMIAFIGAVAIYILTVLVIAINIIKKDMLIKELKEQALSSKETTDWIYVPERSDLGYSSYRCSYCDKEIVMYDDVKPYKYCPFCGRMYREEM